MEYVHGKLEQTPKQARFNPAMLQRLADYYAKLVDSGRVQGVGFLLARDGKVFAHQSCGKLSFEPGRENEALRPDSIKRIASLSKPFTATAIMMLVEEGVIWLDQPVFKILPEFDTEMHRKITIAHLLTHTSGLTADGGYFTEPYPINRFDMMQGPDWLKSAALAGPLQNQPGAAWNYCTIGFVVLGEIITRASGMHFADFVQKRIFEPCGLTRTFAEVPARLHKEVVMNAEWETFIYKQTNDRVGGPGSGGGLYSCLPDLNRFAQFFLNDGSYDGVRLLSKKSVEAMTRNQLDGIPSFHWGLNLKNYRQGLGWGFFADGNTTGPATYNHEGWGWCSLFIDPVERFNFAAFIADSNDWDPDVMVKPRTIAFSGLE